MKIVLIGSGNVAYHLAKAFHQNDVPLVQILGRNHEALEEIHAATGFPICTDWEKIENADIYIVAVKDNAIQECAQKIPNKKAWVLHTAGSVSYREIPEGFQRGVLYPLQTFSKRKTLNYQEIPFFVETEKQEEAERVMQWASLLSSKVMYADENTRRQLHLSAVFACNFTNHLFTLAENICQQNNIPFEYLHPLIFETVDKIKTLSPKDAQTGPAIRKDMPVIEQQLKGLTGRPKEIYQLLTESIIEMYKS